MLSYLSQCSRKSFMRTTTSYSELGDESHREMPHPQLQRMPFRQSDLDLFLTNNPHAVCVATKKKRIQSLLEPPLLQVQLDCPGRVFQDNGEKEECLAVK